MDDLLDDFIVETRENLETLAGQLVQWEQTPQDRALLASVFRFVHTVKGSCGFLDLPRLMRLSHAAEDILSGAREGQVTASTGLVSAVLAVVDRIAALTDALETGGAVYDDDGDLIETMLAYLPQDIIVHTHAPDHEAIDPDVDDGNGRTKARTVRVSLALLDKLMSGVSDMVLARNEVSRQLRKMQSNSELDHSFARLSASVAEMRDAVGTMRMQNIERLFSSLPRMLRDISVELGKEIELRIDGSEVEVDREMVEALRDPLTHILRNAADHGIETADERRAAGKDPVGHIRIIARQSGNQILVEIIDDGRGINLEKLGARAIAAKRITAAEWQKMSEKAQLNTIFMPGLSTADQVSSISGRGVGMDVVKTNLHGIGGTVDVENYDGHGVKMTLRLPLTLSIIAGLSVRAGDQIFGISRNSVVEILSSSNRNVKIEELGGQNIALIRGERYPYARLETLLDIEEAETSATGSRTLIVVRPAIGTVYVLDVASVIDNEELVIKPGAPIVMASGIFAGTTLPDNGRPMLLLDASGLGLALGIEQYENHAVTEKLPVEALQANRPSALLYVASDKVKRAVRLSVIVRMEDVDAASIKFVGGKMRASIGGQLIDICELDQVPEDGVVKLLRLTDGSSVKFLAVEDVIDIFTLDGEIAPSACPEIFEGVISAFGESVELINVYQYFESSVGAAVSLNVQPLCYLHCDGESFWEHRILAPLLTASGYRVSFDAADKDQAAVVLSRSGDEAAVAEHDTRMLQLRDTSHASAASRSSIYRYDRIGLISAIEAKLSGVA